MNGKNIPFLGFPFRNRKDFTSQNSRIALKTKENPRNRYGYGDSGFGARGGT